MRSWLALGKVPVINPGRRNGIGTGGEINLAQALFAGLREAVAAPMVAAPGVAAGRLPFPSSLHERPATSQDCPSLHLRCPRRRRAGRAAGIVAARLCRIDALLARAGGGARGRRLSPDGAEPARLFSRRAAGYAG